MTESEKLYHKIAESIHSEYATRLVVDKALEYQVRRTNGTDPFLLQTSNKSMQDVADALKISVRQIVCIESDDWAQFPAPAIARGFVRSYARFIGVEWAEIVEKLPAQLTTVSLIGDAKPSIAPFAAPTAPP